MIVFPRRGKASRDGRKRYGGHSRPAGECVRACGVFTEHTQPFKLILIQFNQSVPDCHFLYTHTHQPHSKQQQNFPELGAQNREVRVWLLLQAQHAGACAALKFPGRIKAIEMLRRGSLCVVREEEEEAVIWGIDFFAKAPITRCF